MNYSLLLVQIRAKLYTFFLASLWMLPFISSIIGFQSLKWLTSSGSVTTPSVLGMPICKAVTILSGQSLNVRIIKEKEDNSLQPGTVISQSPRAHEKIKRQQSVFLVITKHLQMPQAPNLVGLDSSKAATLAQEKGFKVKIYPLASHVPTNTVLAQLPETGEIEENNLLILYVAQGTTSLRIMPSFVGLSLQEAQAIMSEYGSKPVVRQAHQDLPAHSLEASPTESHIISQQPFAGDIVDMQKLNVELTIASN